MTGHIDPTRHVFAAFRANDRAGPIHMLNLVRLHERARYPDRRQATGAEAYAAPTAATARRCSSASAAGSCGAAGSS